MNNTASFTISYDGEALRTHTMDVRDLAPALLSFGQLFDESNRVLNGNKVAIKVQVKANQAGSFEIVFQATQSISSQMSAFLTGDFVSSALNLKELLFSLGMGLFLLISKLKGKTPSKITDLKNGNVRLEIDTETFDFPLNLLRLYQDISVRSAVEKALKPLENEGIDTFVVKDGGKEITRVEKPELPYFKVPETQDEKLTEKEEKAAYSIISLAFKEDNKWRLYDGQSIISATIRDEKFLNKVEENLVSFAKGDILICIVRTSQWRTSIELKTEYEVLEVKEHKPAARQIPLDFDDITNDHRQI
jgi:hypothetical protein